MATSRPMQITEYSEETMKQYENLADTVAQMRYEIRHDPEGCFGGRGNNIGSVMLENAEVELAELNAAGYSKQTRRFVELCNAGFTFNAIDGVAVIARNGLRVAIPRKGRGKLYNGAAIANWLLDDPEIPADVLAEADALFVAGIDNFRVPVVLES